jgi:hypothetical protein
LVYQESGKNRFNENGPASWVQPLSASMSKFMVYLIYNCCHSWEDDPFREIGMPKYRKESQIPEFSIAGKWKILEVTPSS